VYEGGGLAPAERRDAFVFFAGDIKVEGPRPFCPNGGNLGNWRTRIAMYADRIEQLHGTAGVRAETALAAFTAPSNGGWIMEFVLILQAIAPCDIVRRTRPDQHQFQQGFCGRLRFA
jgi:hypothetical protein